MPEADVSGYQRKVLGSQVRPAKAVWGAEGIVIQDGRALPFVVERQWNAPAGYYLEQWFLIDPGSREILHEGPAQQRLIWGLQSATEVGDRDPGGFPLPAGPCRIVFALGGIIGGEADVHVAEATTESAA
ncbi:MAG TPA: hypothetical protein VNP73_02070 [Actinomycetota bacterium]|nr:hypothetical protein [Actinomycetota bacterium]